MANFHVKMTSEEDIDKTRLTGWFKRTTVHKIQVLLVEVTVTEEALAKIERAGLMDTTLFVIPELTHAKEFFHAQGIEMKDYDIPIREVLISKPLRVRCDNLQQVDRMRSLIHGKLAELSKFLDTVSTTPPPEIFEL